MTNNIANKDHTHTHTHTHTHRGRVTATAYANYCGSMHFTGSPDRLNID